MASEAITRNDLTEILNNVLPLTGLYTTPQTLTDAVSVSANSYATVNADISLNGYTPISIINLQTNMGASVIVIGWNIVGSELRTIVRNMTSSTQSAKVAYRILYAKN